MTLALSFHHQVILRYARNMGKNERDIRSRQHPKPQRILALGHFRRRDETLVYATEHFLHIFFSRGELFGRYLLLS